MTQTLLAHPISTAAFAPYGEVVSLAGHEPILINEGLCRRYSDLAHFDVVDGTLGLSLFHSDIRPLPYVCGLLERHPLGSQCFLPMGGSAYLVIVAPDANGAPAEPSAFWAAPDQGVNIHRNTWHGVLAPISGTGVFAVLDRIGSGQNLEEHRLKEPVTITT